MALFSAHCHQHHPQRLPAVGLLWSSHSRLVNSLCVGVCRSRTAIRSIDGMLDAAYGLSHVPGGVTGDPAPSSECRGRAAPAAGAGAPRTIPRRY